MSPRRRFAIRSARPTDGAAIDLLLDQLPARDRIPGRPLPAGGRLLVAERRDAVVGVGWVTPVPELGGHVARVGLVVDPPQQGQGAGKALVAELVDQGSRWLGFLRFQVVVPAGAHRAVRLFQGAGFLVEGVLRGAVISDGHLADALVLGRLAATGWPRLTAEQAAQPPPPQLPAAAGPGGRKRRRPPLPN